MARFKVATVDGYEIIGAGVGADGGGGAALGGAVFVRRGRDGLVEIEIGLGAPAQKFLHRRREAAGRVGGSQEERNHPTTGPLLR
jgi:hypothetical protein